MSAVYRYYEAVCVDDGERDGGQFRTETDAWEYIVGDVRRKADLEGWLDDYDATLSALRGTDVDARRDAIDDVRDALASAGTDVWVDECDFDTALFDRVDA